MKNHKPDSVALFSGFKPLMLITITVLAISGFGQMPIFKRYYIADIPGLAFLARFYITHFLHYLSAIVFLLLSAYAATFYLLAHRKKFQLTISARIKVFWYTLILVSGIFLIIRNLPGIYQPHALIAFMDLTHMGAVVLLGVTALIAKLKSPHWVQAR
ncbi:FeS-binding protein [Desulfobacterales bacterium HSG17]|nr:FeS-binding protein [Desulfobacterales bacterium HSG17]